MISQNVWSFFKYVYQFTFCGYLFNFSIYAKMVPTYSTWIWRHNMKMGSLIKCCVYCRWCSKFQTRYLCDDYKYYFATLTLGSWLNVECKGTWSQERVFGCPPQDECFPIFNYLEISNYKPNTIEITIDFPSLQRMEQHKYWKSSETHFHKWGRVQEMEPNDSQVHSHFGSCTCVRVLNV
jgi:hypothetical protein